MPGSSLRAPRGGGRFWVLLAATLGRSVGAGRGGFHLRPPTKSHPSRPIRYSGRAPSMHPLRTAVDGVGRCPNLAGGPADLHGAQRGPRLGKVDPVLAHRLVDAQRFQRFVRLVERALR